MLILWIRRNKKNKKYRPDNNIEESFRKHDEDMKRFRHSHQELEALISKDIITTEGDVLAPVHTVKLARHSQN
jgi:hypothetical protein